MRLVIGLALLATAGSAAEPATATGRQLKFTVTPAAAGRQLVRLSLPFSAGMLPEGQGLAVSDGHHETVAAVYDTSNRLIELAPPRELTEA